MENLAVARIAPNFKAVQTASYGDDSGVMAMFDDEFVKNEYKSEREGRAVYDHYYCIELQWPGDNTKTFKYRFLVDGADKGNHWTERFPKQWEAFRNSKQQTPDGTPIEMWPPLDKKRVYELKANKIFTVEQIAALTDMTGPNLGLDWRKMRDQAVAFINPSASMVQVSKLTAENEELRFKMQALEQQVSAMASGRTIPKKRGPKPKLAVASPQPNEAA